MRVFISWSGDRSQRCAAALAVWVPRLLPTVHPWISSASIEPGARWNDQMSRALGELHYGILCVTEENRSAEWMLFEAGALSKSVEKGRVVPYLMGVEPGELRGPLAQFHAVRADEEGTWRLLEGMNAAARTRVDGTMLGVAFRRAWPSLALLLEPISRERPRRSRTGAPLLAGSSNLSNYREQLGRGIRILRVQAGMSQEELAERLGATSKIVGEIERGRLETSLRMLVSISRILKIPPADLIPCA